jgi:glycogen debranching enzyme
VPYPAACTPQAWASVAPVELLRAMLGLEPDGDGLASTPLLPRRLLPLRLADVRHRGRSFTIDVGVDGHAVVHDQAAP